jgi:hypothetical protein
MTQEKKERFFARVMQCPEITYWYSFVRSVSMVKGSFSGLFATRDKKSLQGGTLTFSL